MKIILILTSFLAIALTSFGQNTPAESYGPVPYRKPQQTIGEYYVVPPPPLKIFEEDQFLDYVNKHDNVLYKDVLDKKLRLIKIENNVGYFKDDSGTEYKCDLHDNVSFLGAYPLKELELSRSMFLNKTLWIKNYKARIYHTSEDKYADTLISTFKPVTIIDISPGRSDALPLVFTFKMANGKTACYGIDVSGTNTYRQPQYFLEENFYLKDPHLIYHFTPLVWKQIEAGETPIGMSTDAFELVKGRPTKKNFSQSGNTYHQQWVYGEDSPRYYYFTNDKYTGYN